MADVGSGGGDTHCPWCFKKIWDGAEEQICDDILTVRQCGHRSCSGCFFADNFSLVPRPPTCKVKGCGAQAEKVLRSVKKESHSGAVTVGDPVKVTWADGNSQKHWLMPEEMSKFSRLGGEDAKDSVAVLLMTPTEGDAKTTWHGVYTVGKPPGREAVKALRQLAGHFFTIFVKRDSEGLKAMGKDEGRVLTVGNLLEKALQMRTTTHELLRCLFGVSDPLPESVEQCD